MKPFIDAGYVIAPSVALRVLAVNPPPKLNPETEIRAIRTEEAWEAVNPLQIACRDSSYAAFKRAQVLKRDGDSGGMGERELVMVADGNYFAALW